MPKPREDKARGSVSNMIAVETALMDEHRRPAFATGANAMLEAFVGSSDDVSGHLDAEKAGMACKCRKCDLAFLKGVYATIETLEPLLTPRAEK